MATVTTPTPGNPGSPGTPGNLAPPLAAAATRGFAWLLAQALGNRLVTFAGQIVLAWLLLPEAFGVISKAYTITAFTALLQTAGLRQVLVQRQRHFTRWANAALWMSLATGALAGALTLAAGPWAARFYHSPALVGLLAILAVACPLQALAVVPRAQLDSELRFGAMATWDWIVLVLQTALTIALAWRGYGAYSFVIPLPIGAALSAGVAWWLASPRLNPLLRASPQLPRWRFLVGDTTLVIAANFFATLTRQGDYIVLGRWYDEAVLGVYFLAFSLSTQPVTLLTVHLVGVLLPALSKLESDPARQARAYVRTARVLALVGLPVCLLQAAVAQPAIEALLDTRWLPAVPLLQVLSIGMAFRIVGAPAGTLLQAQGRFGLRLGSQVLFAALFLAMVVGGAWLSPGRPALGVAVAASSYFVIFGLVNPYLAMRGRGAGWGDIAGIYAAPLAVSAVAMGAAVAAGRYVPEMPGRPWWQMLAVAAVGGGLYVLIIRRAAPAVCGEVMTSLAGMRRR